MGWRLFVVVGGLVAFVKAVLLVCVGGVWFGVLFLAGSVVSIVAGVVGGFLAWWAVFVVSVVFLVVSLVLGDVVLSLGFALSVFPHVCRFLCGRVRVEKPLLPHPSEAVWCGEDRVRIRVGRRYVGRKKG